MIVTELCSRVLDLCVDTRHVEIESINYKYYNARQTPQAKDERIRLLPYRRHIRLFSVGGAILPLLSSQGRSATLRWASSSNRISLEKGNCRRHTELPSATSNDASNPREVL